MKLLLDSHAVLWSLYEPEKLPNLTRDAISNEENELFISISTVWELSAKAGAGRLPIGGATVKDLVGRLVQLADKILPLTEDDVIASANLPRHHGDPFDRMLIVQAQALSLILVTKDSKLLLYDVQTLWA